MNPPQLIDHQQDWNRIAPALAREPQLAIDTEANSMYAYRGRICLIQICAANRSLLVDPLAVADLSALGDILANPAVVKILHGSDYDLRCFYREYGFPVAGLFDTETAARFLGMVAPNLAAVLRTFLEVDIPKSRRWQKSNWGLRPLSAPALEYAAADVQHLIPLAQELRRRLTAVDRLAWVEEECIRWEMAGCADLPEPAEPPFLRVKGVDRLEPAELAVFKELFDFREEEARRLDWPAYRVMRNETMLRLARAPEEPLDGVADLSPQLLRRAGGALRDVLRRGRQAPPLHRPPRPRRNGFPGRDYQERLNLLKQWRRDKGAALGLDPALLWPAASLERMARQPRLRDTELGETGSAEIRRWQREQFAPELAAAVQAAARQCPPAAAME